MPFINTTESIGLIVGSGTESVTGSIFITLLLILIFLIVICMMFGIPIEYISIFLLPLCLAYATYYKSFVAIVGIIIIYLTSIITKNWLFR